MTINGGDIVKQISKISRKSRGTCVLHSDRTCVKQKCFSIKAKVILCFAISLMMGSLWTISTQEFNKGIDFAGGMVYSTDCKTCDSSFKKSLEKAIKTTVATQDSADGTIFRIKYLENYSNISDKLKAMLEKKNAVIISSDFASPQMTKTFINDSVFACVFAFLFIGLYMVLRFNWRFATVGIIALLNDVIMALCFINIVKIEFCLITLTALLTIIGYCINDKIVVFDAIREHLSINQDKSIPEILKMSINSVLARSVLTSLTTIIVAFSLLFFGDRFIRDFGIVVIFGIVIGTLSSLILAPNLLLLFKVRHKRNITLEKTPMFYAT